MRTPEPYTPGSTAVTLPLSARHQVIGFENEEGTNGSIAYPINYEELYNLKGRLLTLIDATFTDPQQRKAHKDLVWQTLRAWMTDIENAAGGYIPPKDDESAQAETVRNAIS